MAFTLTSGAVAVLASLVLLGVVLTVTVSRDDAATDAPARVEIPHPSSLGYLSIAADPQSQVYVDGALVGQTGLARAPYAPGRHVVSLVAPDGRRKSLVVDLEAGEELVRTWDFDAMEWR